MSERPSAIPGDNVKKMPAVVKIGAYVDCVLVIFKCMCDHQTHEQHADRPLGNWWQQRNSCYTLFDSADDLYPFSFSPN